MGELGVVILFGPLLTFLFIRAKELLLRRYTSLAEQRGRLQASASPRRAVLAHDMLPPLLRSPNTSGGQQLQQGWNLTAEHVPAPELPVSGTRSTGGPIEQVTLITNAVGSSTSSQADVPLVEGEHLMLFTPIVGETPMRELWYNSYQRSSEPVPTQSAL